MRTAPPITMGKPPSSPTPTGTGGKSRWRSSLRYRRPPSHVCGPHAPVGPPRSGPPRWAGDSSPPSRASSELDPLAASDPQLERRQEDRKDGQSYTDGAGIAELASVERGEVEHRGEDLAGVNRSTLIVSHDVHQRVHVERDEAQIDPCHRNGVAQQRERDPEERVHAARPVQQRRLVDVL